MVIVARKIYLLGFCDGDRLPITANRSCLRSSYFLSAHGLDYATASASSATSAFACSSLVGLIPRIIASPSLVAQNPET